MEDQLLDGAGGAVLGSPGFEFVGVAVEQIGQVMGVLGVVLGAAGDEGFAELLQGDGIDGKEGDPFVGFQEGDEMAGGLFQAQGRPGPGDKPGAVGAATPKGLRGRCQSGRIDVGRWRC